MGASLQPVVSGKCSLRAVGGKFIIDVNMVAFEVAEGGHGKKDLKIVKRGSIEILEIWWCFTLSTYL